ncbi:BLUF domain-containing protein [Hymenobacter mucosus]|uniref:Sensors of blue-light using FAD n=1 Tax=Hymenobacter mucosus TaxID=1411120 RepID=A0A239AIZ1_9BACT|nr:BLUF domain-containing protein [Hymenobacter mucosus]SNR95636.1 Sensors of blue-light using FAD [Hymenobacter mucosus]
MHHIVYVSSATVPMPEAELEAYLQRWRANNERDNITGVLLYSQHEQRFMQLVEGQEEDLHRLLELIEKDQRHHNLLKLSDGPIPARAFRSWLMGFKVLDTAIFNQLTGYIDPESKAYQQALQGSQDELIHSLLAHFPSEQSPELS